MIIPDINLLIYAHNINSKEHSTAKKWWEDLINSETTILLPWIVISGFIRLVTSRHVLENPLPSLTAINIIKNITANYNISIISPGNKHFDILQNFTKYINITGSNFTDSQLAALAIEHNATIYSNDLDFQKFPGLKYINPLA